MFSSQPFPTQFPPASNPFVQPSFGTSKINHIYLKNNLFLLFIDTSNFFGMPPTNQPNPFMVNIPRQLLNFFNLYLLEYCSTTTSPSPTITQSIRKTTCKFNKSISLILKNSNKTHRKISSKHYFIYLLSHFHEPHINVIFLCFKKKFKKTNRTHTQ